MSVATHYPAPAPRPGISPAELAEKVATWHLGAYVRTPRFEGYIVGVAADASVVLISTLSGRHTRVLLHALAELVRDGVATIKARPRSLKIELVLELVYERGYRPELCYCDAADAGSFGRDWVEPREAVA